MKAKCTVVLSSWFLCSCLFAIHAQAVNYTLTVTISGTGLGAVTSNPAGISCTTGTCTGSFASDTVVNLIETPNSGSNFVDWSGACAGTAPCSVTMSADVSVGTTFNVSSPTACGNTLNWTDPSCQLIASGALNTALVNGVADSNAWTVISRHGEYAQSENECNIPSALSVVNSSLDISTTASAYACGNFNADGTINTTPASWPYSTGDVQWNRFNFTYGTVIARFKLPAKDTGTWPAIWMIGSNCQDSNKYSGDTGFDGCPNLGSAGYREIDLLECFQGNWCNFNVFNPGQVSGLPSTCNSISDTNYHTLVTSWTAGSITQTLDGSSTCSFTGAGVPNAAMVLIMQIQTQPNPPQGPPVNANLPANMYVDYVKVCDTSLSAAQCSAAANNAAGVIFYDDFTNGSPPAPPTGLGAVVK